MINKKMIAILLLSLPFFMQSMEQEEVEEQLPQGEQGLLLKQITLSIINNTDKAFNLIKKFEHSKITQIPARSENFIQLPLDMLSTTKTDESLTYFYRLNLIDIKDKDDYQLNIMGIHLFMPGFNHKSLKVEFSEEGSQEAINSALITFQANEDFTAQVVVTLEGDDLRETTVDVILAGIDIAYPK